MCDPAMRKIRNRRMQKLAENRLECNELCQHAKENQLIPRKFQEVDLLHCSYMWPPRNVKDI